MDKDRLEGGGGEDETQKSLRSADECKKAIEEPVPIPVGPTLKDFKEKGQNAGSPSPGRGGSGRLKPRVPLSLSQMRGGPGTTSPMTAPFETFSRFV